MICIKMILKCIDIKY